jgi:hypothetical protein
MGVTMEPVPVPPRREVQAPQTDFYNDLATAVQNGEARLVKGASRQSISQALNKREVAFATRTTLDGIIVWDPAQAESE